MKKTKRLVLLAISAVLVVAAVSPAVASAQEQWLINGEPFEGEIETPYEAELQRPVGWMSYGIVCTFRGMATLSGGTSQAQIDTVDTTLPLEESWCRNPWGYNPGCYGRPSGEELPWSLDYKTNGKLDYFKLDTNMLNEENEPCFYNEDLKVWSSTMYRNSYGQFVGDVDSEAAPGSPYIPTHGGSLDFDFPEVGYGYYP